MPLKRLRLLQLGDLHFPTAVKGPRNIDDKDKQFAPEFRNRISTSALKVVMRQCSDLIEARKVSAVLFMGDATDRGKINGYEDGITYLVEALQIGGSRTYSDLPVYVVPGNHDIDRDLAQLPDKNRKFEVLNEFLFKKGITPFPYDSCKSVTLPGSEKNFEIHLLNSCIGCGVSDGVPSLFRDEVSAAIERVLDKDPKALEIYYDRQLDAPAVSDSAIQELVSVLQSSRAEKVHLIVAHHNLLPQRLTRIAPYTELINSGSLRATLLEAKQPTIFLHGHIHDDPVEVVSDPSGKKTISVSAPELSCGFNIIEVVFTSDDMPLAVKIEPWRIGKTGHLSREQDMTVSLLSHRRRAQSTISGDVLAEILKQKSVFWGDLMQFCQDLNAKLDEGQLQEELEILMAERFISVENSDMSSKHWIVRSVI
ncbi:metallophosphoesterase family protein [Tritonibacter sp. SIMBA_163]|uniref:metallophosphoesterase family protein n=1 Tax=Tritonibacter sp. SIMBA_163 TaxID=3080868 RepID=UPI00397FFB7F